MSNDEYGNWKDRGCQFHPSCLECPEPVCILEEGRKHHEKKHRSELILSLLAEGKTPSAIAQELGIHVRTIQRDLKESSGRSLRSLCFASGRPAHPLRGEG